MGERLDLYKDKAKEWRWRMVSTNGNILATSSEGYKNKKDMLDSLYSVSVFMSGRVDTPQTYSCSYCKHTGEEQLKYCGLCGQKIKE